MKIRNYILIEVSYGLYQIDCKLLIVDEEYEIGDGIRSGA